MTPYVKGHSTFPLLYMINQQSKIPLPVSDKHVKTASEKLIKERARVSSNAISQLTEFRKQNLQSLLLIQAML